MKAAFLVGPRSFALRDIPDPACPPDGLVMEVAACGVCGSDLRRWKEGPPAGSGGVIPGHEAAGVIAQVGPQCRAFAVGDRIAIAPDIHCGSCYFCRRERYNLCDDLKLLGITPGYPGGFAEKLALDGNTLHNGIVHAMPAGLSFRHAAVSEPACSVLATQNKADTQAGDTVVIIGAGPTGCLHIAMARARGARVVVAQRSKTRQELAARFGPDRIIDVTREDMVQAVLAFTGGLGADVVICANPVADTQRQAVECVRKGGRVLLFGGLPKADPVTHLDGNKIHYGEVEVMGAFSYHPRVHRQVLDLLAQGKLPADLLITGEFPLDQIDQAYASAATGNALKVLITFGKGD
jgi:L-iditol 2-dehydrogenase